MRPLLRLALAIALLLYPLSASADIMISLEPSAQQATVGSTVFLDVMASGLNLGAFNLTVSFDPLLLFSTDIEFDTFLGAPDSIQNSSAGLSSVNLAEISLVTDPAALIAMQPGKFRLAQLAFATIAAGVTTISFSDATVADPYSITLLPDLASAMVTINAPSGGTEPVPEPRGGVLCATALLALGGIGMWRRKRLIRGGPRPRPAGQ